MKSGEVQGSLPPHRQRWIKNLVDEFNRIHGNKYVYTDMNYTTMPKSITPLCPAHGVFTVQARAHLQGAPCPSCNPRRVTLEKAISRFRDTHGDKFDYSKVHERYVTFYSPAVEVICPKHGSFFVKPVNHYKTTKGIGCNKCRLEHRKIPRKEIIKRITDAGQGHLIPSDFAYQGALTKTRVVCPRHGEFYAYPVNLQRGHGCSYCSKMSSNEEDAWITAISTYMVGWKMFRNHRVSGVSTAIDAVFYSPTGVRVGVEYDGSYWHNLPGSYTKDTNKTKYMKQAGIKVVRLRALEPHKKQLKDIKCADANFHVNHKGPYSRVAKEIAKEIIKIGE